MGYYTQFELSYFNDDEQLSDCYDENINDYLQKENEDGWCISNMIDGDEHKWYDHDKDMKKMSKKFKDKVFLLEGIGEETDDHWWKYYLNGKVFDATPPKQEPLKFDRSKLQ